MKSKFIEYFMDIAERTAQLSYCERLKVGCIIVSEDQRIISIGYNGTPVGWDNCCEIHIEVNSERGEFEDYVQTVTKDEVIHAEQNALDKITRSNDNSTNATMFITHAPCLTCAKRIAGSYIKTVYYKYLYRDTVGLEYLKKFNIETIKLDEKTISNSM